MKRIIYALLATLSGVVLLFSYRTSLEPVTPTVLEPATSGSVSGTAPTRPQSSDTTSGGSSAVASASGLTDGTYTGDSVGTRYGPVQVRITVSGGSIADVQVPTYPDSNGRDRQINQSAIPRLVDETIAAQNAQIDMVSGATYTSQGYLTSLQSAIDQAQS